MRSTILGLSLGLATSGTILLAGACGDKEEVGKPAPGDDTASDDEDDDGGDTADDDDGDDTADDDDGDDTGGGGGGCVAVQGSSGASSAELGVSPATHDFGSVDLGCADSLTVVVENRGGATLSLDGVDFATGSEDMSLDGASLPALPHSLGPGDAVCLVLHYVPADTYADSGYLQIASSDPTSPDVLVTVAGEGKSVGSGSDSFTASGGTTFALSQVPLSDSLTVRIDGVTAASGWTWDSAANAVEFDSSYVPEPGATVDVSYELSGC